MRLVFLALAAVFFATAADAQIKIGADLYSRYIWRGVDFGNSVSFQPAITYTAENFSLGAWGAYSITKSDSTTYAENDLWASYSIGSLVVSITDYYVPTAVTPPFFDYSNSGGAHIIELGASYTLTDFSTITISGYVNVLNDVDHSMYFQAAQPILENLSLLVGLTPVKSSFYGTKELSVINIGLAATKTIKISESYALPLNVQYIMNPYAEKAYLVFGVSGF